MKDSTTAVSGVPLLEDATGLKTAIESGDWAAVAMGAVGTALDALTAVMDPFGAIFAAGVGWLIEHVGPLKEALNALTGNADEIAAQSETWTNVAKELESVSTELVDLVKKDLGGWTGPAADAYRTRARDTSTLIASAQKGCEGAASGVKTAGEVVAAVRTLVRDIIAELVGHLISWALQVVFTLGIGLTWVVPQVVAAVAKTASKIASLTTKLVKALKALMPLLKKAGTLFDDAAKALRKIKPGKVKPAGKPKDITAKPSPEPKPHPKDGDTTGTAGDHSGNHSGGDGTHTSGDHGSSAKNPPPDGTRGGPGNHENSGSGGGNDGVDTAGAKGNPHDNTSDPAKNKEPEKKCTGFDPIDLATGDLLVTETDLLVPGDLGALVVRNHVSSYRDGRWFGPSWTSVVDERLERVPGGLRYFSADAMVLTFPVPGAGAAVTAAAGPLRLLHADGDEFALTDPGRGWTRRFRPHPRLRDTLLLHEIRTEEGESVSLGYDDAGVPATIAHSAGARLVLHVADGRLRGIQALGEARPVQVARYEYDEHGHLSVRHNSSPRPAHYTHDREGRLLGWIDHVGHWYRQVYDAQGRVVRAIGEGGYLEGTLAYSAGRTVTTDSLGHQRILEFDEAGNLVADTDRLGATTRFSWGRYQTLATRTDPLGRRTEFEHDASGRLRTVVRPDGSRVEIVTRTATELVIAVADGDRTRQRRYTAPLLPDPYADVLGGSAEHDPEPAAGPGAMAAPVAPGERDMFGRPRTVRSASGGRETLSWSVEGELHAVAGADGARYQWLLDAEGAAVRRTDPLNRVTATEYGPFGLVTATTDPSGARTLRRYDTELRQVSVTNPAGQTWEFTLDAEGRMTAQRDFGGRVSRYEYDTAGQLVRSTNAAGESVTYSYDLLGSLVRRESAARTDTYRYDPVGNLVHASGPGGETTLEYDDTGRVLRQTTTGRTTSFAYTGDAAVTRRTPSGVVAAWSRGTDGTDRLDVAGVELVLAHDAAGHLTEVRERERTLLGQEFDANGRLIGQRTPIGSRRFHRGLDGGVTERTDATGAARYERDQLGRITAVHTSYGTEQYHYDVLGDLVSSSVGTGAEAGPRRYAGGVPQSAGAVRYAHDAQGRMTARTVAGPEGAMTWTFAWDPHDQLVGVRTPDGGNWRYVYDSLDRRVAKQRLDPAGRVAEQVEFVWDGIVLVEALHSTAGVPTTTLTWAHHPDDDRPLVQVLTGPDGATRPAAVLVTDAVGTPVELVGTDGGGALLPTTLWGRAPAGAEATPLRFPGQYHDPETGLHFNVFRYYDPGNARYLNPDPLGLRPAPNPQTYVADPLGAADPSGLTDDLMNNPLAYGRDPSTRKRKCTQQFGQATQGSPSGGKKQRLPGRTSSTKPGGSSGKPEWDQKPSGPKHDGRHESQGGGRETGPLKLDGSDPANAMKGTDKGNCTDVPQIMDAKAKGTLTPEFKNLLGDSEMIKGHMHTERLGGAGDAPNLTPLSKKANTTMSGQFEAKLFHANDTVGLIKRARPDDDVLTARGYSPQEISRLNKAFDDLHIDYSVKTSDNLKLPNSTNEFERSVRDHLELRSDLKMDPELARYLQQNNSGQYNQLMRLMPGNMNIDTMSGALTRVP
ncbi:DUF6531 domain-containing protein [Amycolatopsis sp. OK19-0408]|uniref:DUF6531 domain-containing protein n=1 Tax=Amycolatopsis iheyensis TaxID=2945988 RepID=A0A9X2N7R0_9PSEU|nr:RHS repeat-associated core domain-containing protein [Amycolatopsis iheyensis]MCR6482802.1 DUF6531 domain-containing protein [Amycolatopsis iheyensis]